jgi:hypothetical protein
VLTDQLRYPPVYESQELRRLRRERMLGRHQDDRPTKTTDRDDMFWLECPSNMGWLVPLDR